MPMMEMMHSGWFVAAVLAAIVVGAAMYLAVRVIGGRTQSREHAAGMSRTREAARATETKRLD